MMKDRGEQLVSDADWSYGEAERQATSYFKILYKEVSSKSYVPILINDLRTWKCKHIRRLSLIGAIERMGSRHYSGDYQQYIDWLRRKGKLENYLNRSISYIMLRDLGKVLDAPDTQAKIADLVAWIGKRLGKNGQEDPGDDLGEMSIHKLYRRAQKEGVQDTFVWLLDKLLLVANNIPKQMDADHAQRKLIKIIVGVLLHELQEMGDDLSQDERRGRIEGALRLGYAYGLTYPFIDDLLDAKVLSPEEKREYGALIRQTLLTGIVPALPHWNGENEKLISYIHSELAEAFEFIKSYQKEDCAEAFFEQSYIFFNAQEKDRNKSLAYTQYSNEALYIPIILKSSFSRLVARSVTSPVQDAGFDERIFYYGIYNQLADDFADMFEDAKEGAVTPYTYYLKYHEVRPDLINPFQLYWAVISHLIHQVYHCDPKTTDILLSRAINGLRRFKERMGEPKYNEVMTLLAAEEPQLYRVIKEMVHKATDVDFFDKLFRDHFLALIKKQRQEQVDFLDQVKRIRIQINNQLHIAEDTEMKEGEDIITLCANYSLEGGGKRLRPIITWVMAVEEYGLDEELIYPLVKSLEYMHTASLIFDDLPSQDHAMSRRGRATLHEVHNTAIAELTGLFLTQKAIEEQTYMTQYGAETVLQVIRYGTQVVTQMCKGQAMDLCARGKVMTLDELNEMCFYKTGIAFEVALVMPAMLTKLKETYIQRLKQYAYHAGIAFQIKDDLLDAEGEVSLLGKSTGKDRENNNATFVSILGQEGAREAMWEHYCLAMEVLEDVPQKTSFLKQLLGYIVNRDH